MKARARWTIRVIVGIILALYLVTGVMGVPAVRESVKKDFDDLVVQAHGGTNPSLSISWTFPVLPFVILSHHGWMVNDLCGRDVYYFYFWYPGHVRLVWGAVQYS